VSATDEWDDDGWDEDEDEDWEEDWDEEEEDWEDDAWDAPAPRPTPSGSSGFHVRSDVLRGLPLGFVACLPLLFAYEVALMEAGTGWRGTAEYLLLRGLQPLGDHLPLVRTLLLIGLGGWAMVALVRDHPGVVPALLRVAGEGVLAAVLLGPILIGLLHLSGVEPTMIPARPDTAPPGSHGLLVMGAAAWEELLFRMLAYGGLYVLTLHLARYLGMPRPLDRAPAELVAIVGQAVLFAAAHVRDFVQRLGAYGEPFDAASFQYRVLAGILLGVLFRWRGLGVAAWAHAVFNLALLLGAGPQRF
jgi:hypothetical protein